MSLCENYTSIKKIEGEKDKGEKDGEGKELEGKRKDSKIKVPGTETFRSQESEPMVWDCIANS